MKVVILAAGKGSRLKKGPQPKPLTLLENGLSILAWQIQALTQFISIDHIFIVVGYHKEKIMEQFPELTYIYNPDFATENTSKSLLRALKKIDQDTLWLNGDVVFHPSILEPLFQCQQSTMIVNQQKADEKLSEEEVKYSCNSKGKIIEVSKQVINPQGEALGLNFFTTSDLKLLKKALEACQNEDYFERAIEMCIQQAVSITPLVVDYHLCVEVDFPADLEKANHLLSTWS